MPANKKFRLVENAAEVEHLREESRLTLGAIVIALGRPVEWAEALERDAFNRGVAWELTEAA